MLLPKPTRPKPSVAGADDPLQAALARLLQLAHAGAAPDAVVTEVGSLVAGWANEPEMDAATAQSRIEALWDELTRTATDLEASLNDAGDAGRAAQAGARRSLAAFRAATAALLAAHGRL